MNANAINLRTILQEEARAWPLSERLSLFAKLCWQVAALHRSNLMHGNITPEKIWVRGSVPALDAPSAELKKIFGYSAPELLRGERQANTPRTDIFSLGVLCYELISLQKPFQGKSDMEILLATLEGKPTPLTRWLPECPDALNSLCLKMLSPNKENRPAAVEEIAALLDEMLYQLATPQVIEPKQDDPHSAISILKEPPEEHPPDETQSPLGFEETQALSNGASQPSPGDLTPRSGSGQSDNSNRAHIFPPKSSPSDTLAHGNVGSFPALSQQAPSPSQRYKVVGELARGGLGKILRATDQHMGRPVAIKEMLRQLPGEFEARFLREAKITARLEHPAIIPVHDLGRWADGSTYYTMKLVDGRSFEKTIAEARTLEERIALLPHVIAAADAMAYSHSQRIIHRDLKPHNVLIGPFGETVVIDWGIAKDVNDANDLDSPESPYRESPEHGELTKEGAIVGTPAYMPIEQAQGKRVDERADVYSLGAILYHLLSGKSPYSGKRSIAILKELLDGPPMPLREREPNTPSELITIVEKAMARDPSARYPTAKEFADDLKKYQTGQLVGSHRYSSWDIVVRTVKKHRALFAVSALAAVALLMSATWYTINLSEKEARATRSAREANLAKADAEEKSAEIEKRNEREIQSTEALKLESAKRALQDNPSEAISWLKQLRNNYPQPLREVQLVAEEALLRGLPKTYPKPENPKKAISFAMAVSPDQRYVATPEYFNTTTDAGEAIFGIVGLRETSSGTYRELISNIPNGVNGVWFSPDGKWLAAAGADWKIYLWATSDWALIATLEASTSGEALSISFSPDAQKMVASGSGNQIYLWELQGLQRKVFDLSSEKTLAEYASVPLIIWSITFSPLGDALAASRSDGVVLFLDLAQGTVKSKQQKLVDISFSEVAFSSDGKTILVSGHAFNGTLLWQPRSNTSIIIPETLHPAIILPEQKIAGGTTSNSISIWDVSGVNPARLKELRETDNYFSGLTLSPQGNLLSASNIIGEVFLWDLRSLGSPIRTYYGATFSSFSLDGARLYGLSTKNNTVSVWDIPKLAAVGKSGSGIQDFVWRPGTQMFATISLTGGVNIWNSQTNELLHSLDANGVDLDISEDGRLLVAATQEASLWIWDLQTDRRQELKGLVSNVVSLDISPEGDHFLSTQLNGDVLFWDMKTMSSTHLTSHPGNNTGRGDAKFSLDGKLLATTSPNAIEFWETKTLKKISSVSFDEVVMGLLFSPNGKNIAVWGPSALWLGDLTKAPPSFSKIPTSDSLTLYRAAFSPSGAQLALSLVGTFLLVLDIESNHFVKVPLPTRLPSMEYNPTTEELLIATQDGSLFSWARSVPQDPQQFWSWLSKQE